MVNISECSAETCSAYNVESCRRTECGNHDTDLTPTINNNWYSKICYSHPVCTKCNKMRLQKLLSCNTCYKSVCWDCVVFINKITNDMKTLNHKDSLTWSSKQLQKNY